MINQALFSNKKDYRYMLSRFWDESRPILGIIGLQPSYGDAKVDDDDIIKQVEIAKSLGYGGLYSMNLFAILSTENNKLHVGENNDKYLKLYLSKCQRIICAWGDKGRVDNRGDDVRRIVDNLYYIELTTSGEPIDFNHIKLGIEPIKF